jgi:hypothetical protein
MMILEGILKGADGIMSSSLVAYGRVGVFLYAAGGVYI